MTYPNKHIVDAYAGLLEGLSTTSKLALIESLSQSLRREKDDKDTNFYQSFGAFGTDKSAEEIIADIKASRQFRKKDVSF